MRSNLDDNLSYIIFVLEGGLLCCSGCCAVSPDGSVNGKRFLNDSRSRHNLTERTPDGRRYRACTARSNHTYTRTPVAPMKAYDGRFCGFFDAVHLQLICPNVGSWPTAVDCTRLRVVHCRWLPGARSIHAPLRFETKVPVCPGCQTTRRQDLCRKRCCQNAGNRASWQPSLSP